MKINRSTYYFALIFLLFFNSFYAQQESKPTNIIFYLSDDQDLLDYGVYGNPKVETSNVDLLASQGIKFTNFYAQIISKLPVVSKIGPKITDDKRRFALSHNCDFLDDITKFIIDLNFLDSHI